MDYQERELRTALEGTGVEIERQGDDLRLVMPSEITFDFDSSAIKPSFYGILTNVSDVMINYPETVVQIAGHTDSVGSEAYNQGLSVQRAGAVRNFLVGRAYPRPGCRPSASVRTTPSPRTIPNTVAPRTAAWKSC